MVDPKDLLKEAWNWLVTGVLGGAAALVTAHVRKVNRHEERLQTLELQRRQDRERADERHAELKEQLSSIAGGVSEINSYLLNRLR